MEDNETIQVERLEELHAWLLKNENRTKGIWLVRYKAGSNRGEHIEYSEMVDELLCFGWIDSRPRTLDEDRSMNWISPRNPQSAWSKINKEKVSVLQAQGRLRPAAIAQIEAAKRSGAWDRLTEIEDGLLPPDLVRELENYAEAKSNFEAFPKSVKKSILEWIVQAKTEETRRKRILETAEKASRNIRANQWKDKNA